MLDMMLLRGRGILKAWVDPFDKFKVKFKSIDPLFIIMAEEFDDFDNADEFVEIEHTTVTRYQRNRNYDQDPSTIAAIRGRRDPHLENILLDKQVREGVTHSSKSDIVVLWHHYVRTSGGWVLSTYAPMAIGKQITPPKQVASVVDGTPAPPYFSFTMEVKDPGWFSPRGVAELSAAFEAYLCKLWNNKSDTLTFVGTPMFTSQGEIPNIANLRMLPGEIWPGNIQAIQMPQVPQHFSEEMEVTRELAEQRVQMPDFGIESSAEGKPRTATENNRIAGLQQVGADHNGDVFRTVRLAKFYKFVWSEMVRHKQNRNRVTYYVGTDLMELPAQAVHDEYLVIPDGSAGTKDQRLQRAVGRFQMFKGAPNVDQDELVRDVLACDDSRLVRRLLVPSKVKNASEAEDEAVEIGTMLIGFPAPVSPGEDHATRIMVCLGFLHKQGMTGQTVDPATVNLIQQHIAQHFQYLKQLQPQAARQLMASIQEMESAPQQPMLPGQQPPQGQTPMSPAGPPTGQPGPQPGQPPQPVAEKVSINYKDAPEDVKRQIEAAAGFQPSRMSPAGGLVVPPSKPAQPTAMPV
jgi:hypothetical protein